MSHANEHPAATCPTCAGHGTDGRFKRDCPTCSGTGRLPWWTVVILAPETYWSDADPVAGVLVEWGQGRTPAAGAAAALLAVVGDNDENDYSILAVFPGRLECAPHGRHPDANKPYVATT